MALSFSSVNLRRLACRAGLLVSALLPFSSVAQTTAATSPSLVEFTGAVFSDTGHQLAGATVAVEGKAMQAASANAEGFFLLRLPAGQPARLLVAFPSHESQVVELKAPEKEKNLVITLHQVAKYPAGAKALRARQKKYQRTGQ
ncbi:peptidase associated/transthyretin-like domain-containing protein [Hymenobacter pini]|uniref:hypothetical protein n=1 Tax=Hymenobacter pini TaxID=2880879 RepID=UPI001CF36C86|nr:hypothetical protein [Hymenobacter pini]MCA8833265.1 hypothetical protein [Hymenobacter pini]